MKTFKIVSIGELAAVAANVKEKLDSPQVLAMNELLEVQFQLDSLEDLASDWQALLPERLKLIKSYQKLAPKDRVSLEAKGYLQKAVNAYADCASKQRLIEAERSIRVLLSVIALMTENSVRDIVQDLISDLAYGQADKIAEFKKEFGVGAVTALPDLNREVTSDNESCSDDF